MLCSLSKLESRGLDSIKSLEKELHRPLLAFSCHDLKPAELTTDELKKIQSLEKELGLALVAVEASAA